MKEQNKYYIQYDNGTKTEIEYIAGKIVKFPDGHVLPDWMVQWIKEEQKTEKIMEDN